MDEREKEIRERCDEASPGTWDGPACESEHDQGERIWSWRVQGDSGLAWETDSGCPGYGLSKADANFCCHAREDIPWLLSQLAEAQSELAEERAKREEAEKRAKELEADNSEKNRHLASLVRDVVRKDLIPSPCYECGGTASYDGVKHMVSCDECNNYYQNIAMSHADNIRHWNDIPRLKLRLVLQRAENAEAERDAPERRVHELESTFRHTHTAKYIGDVLLDRCGHCGLDLRDSIHDKAILTAKTKEESK